ncbi:hypothetical protein A3A63_03370 [Candidatus Gottesmanbacteria bacterium RIFCSPLOWO2_01_FULL_46_9]|uniref:Glycosyltransferase 2-like domain-containing protein n=1 Tax=Candidatus Gottesmanbacteria bacterium RIFCSPLOWO2_01_FULL_46_9 TaxID=1798394 RepID=A0A1F6AY95_9BACT|nr:MAG: hypothetical protein A3A63_03370 [Candidatus Gottesmanbacteria bacterium RIFCSPLOWO2_01_FULL_46_9]
MISIIIPTLNEEKFLPHLLTSLTQQSECDFEVIVVDGNSKDKTVDVAQSFQKKLPKLTVLKSPPGVSRQRNLGASKATGEWLVFIDADSVLLPYFFDRLTNFIQERKPKHFTTWFKPDSEVSGDALFVLIGNLFIEGSVVFHRPIAPGPLVAVTHEVFDKVHGFDETLAFGEDYDFTRKIDAMHIPLQILRETLYVYSLRRVRSEGKIGFIQLYARASVLVFLTKRNLRNVPGYITGGHLYNLKKKPIKRSVIRQYEMRLRSLIKEFFE